MIFVDRNAVPFPEGLRTKKAEAEIAKLFVLYQERSVDHLEQLRIEFEPAIWSSTKPALVELFKNKCAFCESALHSNVGGNIEHFRPKRGATQTKGASSNRHYGWLAYDWDNLYLACPSCAQPHGSQDGTRAGKGNQFPVDGDLAPLLAPVHACRSAEVGTLLDPCFDEPTEHLTFLPTGNCVGTTLRGNLSIRVFGLNRDSLVRARNQVYLLVKATFDRLVAAENSNSEIAHVRQEALLQQMLQLTSPSAPYAGAARFYLSSEMEKIASTGSQPNLMRNFISRINALKWTPIRTASNPIQDSTVEERLPITETKWGKFEGRRMLPDRPTSRISRIEINNFKSINSLKIDVPYNVIKEGKSCDALVLLGENAAGKSTVLEATAMTLMGVKEIKRLRLDAEAYLSRDNEWELIRRDAQVRIYFDNEEKPGASLNIDATTGEFSGTDQMQVVVLGYGPRRFFVPASKGNRRGKRESVKSLFDQLYTITDPEYWLSHCTKQDYNSAIRALREILGLNSESLVTRRRVKKGGGIEISVGVNNINTPISRLSEGYRSMMATAIDTIHELLLYWPSLEQAQGVVLIDELETHLHPRWKMRILRRLRRAMPKVQFIVTTHDPLCLRGARNGEVQVLERNTNGQIAVAADLPGVQGLSVQQLLTSDFFGLLSSEDPEMEETLIEYGALVMAPELDAAGKTKMKSLGRKLKSQLVLGSTPQEQLIHQAATELLLKTRQQPAIERKNFQKEAVSKMVSMISELNKMGHLK